jgi:NitT/TauT family transport system substrate-binding protein
MSMAFISKALRRPYWLFATVGGLFATAVLAPGAALSQAAAPAPLELKIALADDTINPVTDSVVRLADTLGYYKAHGVHVTIISLSGTPQAVAAMNSGDVDLADIAVDASLRLRATNGVPIRAVVSSTLGPPYLIAVKQDIKSLAGLAGRTFAIADNGSLDDSLTRAVLAKMGVKANAINFVAIGAPAARVQALAAGRVDATTVSYGSFLPVAKTPGLNVLVTPDAFFDAAPIQSKYLVGLEATLAKRHDAIQRFVDALIDLSRHYDGNAAAWVTDMAPARPDLAKDDLTSTTKYLAGRWCVNGCLKKDDIQKTVDFIYSGPDFAGVKVIPATDVIDESFVLQAIKDLGAYKGGGNDAR